MLIRTSAATYAFSAAIVMAGAAAAQTAPAPPSAPATPQPAAAPTQMSEIVVTGSRIARRDYVSDTPTVTASNALISPTSSGSVTLEGGLNFLPQVAPSAGASASFAGNGGQANIDLRGMGSQRTLVLVDGNRFVPSLANGTVDVNNIPSAFVDNVEVITGGASATYGSDAIAGVVNIKLKQQFTGVEIDAQTGETDRGDGGSQDIAVMAGSNFAENRGNAYIGFDYASRASINAASRSYLAGWGISTNLPSSDVLATSTNLPSQAALNAVFGRYGFAAGTVLSKSSLILSTNADGTLFTQQNAINYKGPTSAPLDLVTAAGQYGASAGQVGLLNSAEDTWFAQLPMTRYSLVSRVNYEVNSNLSLYFEGLYTHYDTTEQSNPAVAGSSCCTPLVVPVTNPFIPADLATILASRPHPTASFSITQALYDFGTRDEEDQYNVYQFTLGAKGSLPFNDVTWNAYASRGEMQDNATLTGYASSAALNTLLSAPGGGTGICAGGYDPFGIHPLSASCYAYLNRVAHNSEDLAQDVVELDTQGRLFNLPAGEARFAAGADYRDNSYSFSPDSEIAIGDLANTPAEQASSGSENVKEVYLELLAPLVRDLPLAKAVNLDAGYRYSSYSISGGVSTYKVDFDWKVDDWFGLRGGYDHATRAPSVGDLFEAVTGSQVSIGNAGAFGSGDPCDSTSAYLNPTKNPNASKVAALCTAQGVPTGFVNIQPRPASTTEGNLNLQPESADTFSIGGIFRSRFSNPLISKASLSIDYYHIAVSKTMGTIGGNAILDDCYSATTNPTFSTSNYYCQLISRNSGTGLIANIQNPLLNLGQYTTAGIDVEGDWSAPLSGFGLPDQAGEIGLNVMVNYLASFDIQSVPGGPTLDYAGTIGNTQIDQYADAHPRWKGVTTLFWNVGPVQTSFRWRYIGAMSDYAFVGTSSTGPGAPAISYYDLNAEWKVRPGLVLSAGVVNLLNKAPPTISWMAAGTDLYTYDIVGRRGFIALKVKF